MPPRIGQVLRKTRRARGLELSEVERATKIRVKFLQAMEEDRWEELPAPVYARGFLEIYARYLGLDDEALVDRYRRTVEGADRAEPIPRTVLRPGTIRPRRSFKPVGVALAGLLAAVVLIAVIIGTVASLDDGGESDGERRAAEAGTESEGSTTGEAADLDGSTLPSFGSGVSLELRSTGTVWVCLVDDQDRARVNGETLVADEVRGPFTADSFEATFGNGAVEMTVDGHPTEVPRLAEPLGFRIDATGVRRLDPASQPSCL
jgi:cytoskeleton protein RodZ